MPQKSSTSQPSHFKILVLLLCVGFVSCESFDHSHKHGSLTTGKAPQTHSCIHDRILEQQWRSGVNQYKYTPQVYENGVQAFEDGARGRDLLSIPSKMEPDLGKRQPIRILLNYDAVGHSADRDCRSPGNIVKLGEPPPSTILGFPACSAQMEPPVYGDCWYNCTSEDITGEDKKNRLHEALGEAAAWFKRALSVERVKGALRLSGYSACGQDGGVQLPRRYIDEGIENADLVLLVTTRPTTGNTLAWAVACERDQWGRAIAGHINVAPRHLTAEAETLLSATLIHEVMHVLGFDPHAFAHFRDEFKLRRSEVVVQEFDSNLGRMVTRVILPHVMAHSRQHYGAYTKDFTGLELEDGGGRGTAGSHWEKRLLMNEIMTGSVDTRSVVSAMTLALLEDSGWYKANYSMAEKLDWGRNQGSEFLLLRCDAWNGAYHCNNTALSGCTYNREAEGFCPISKYNGDLPAWARYFPEANKGGQSSLADYCAYFVAYSDGSCIDTTGARAPDRMLGETRGHDSRCMASSLVRSGFVRGSMTQGNGCYLRRCINHTLEVAVDGVWRPCPEEGGQIEFPGFNGNLVCPKYHELCEDVSHLVPGQCPHHCHNNGECFDGECHCFQGFGAQDCSQRVCPSRCSGHGSCVDGLCQCDQGYTGVDCSTAGCDEQCSLHGGVCDNGVCEFRCSDYAGYTCQNNTALVSSLSWCKDVLVGEAEGQHCAPSEMSVLQQLEMAVVLPNYNRLIPSSLTLISVLDKSYCSTAAKRLACWISIQRCDMDGDNRLRVCHSVCESYNMACGARLDCSDRTLFSGEEGSSRDGMCTGDSAVRTWWQLHLGTLFLVSVFVLIVGCLIALQHACHQQQVARASCWVPSCDQKLNGFRDAPRDHLHGPYVVLTEAKPAGGGGLWGTGMKEEPREVVESNNTLSKLSNALTMVRTPSRGSFREILLDRTGQLSSRGSPRKGDHNLTDVD